MRRNGKSVTRSCHKRHMKMTGAKTINFAFFQEKICEIHRFRSCHFRDTNVTNFVHTRHENNRSCYDEFHSFFSKKIVKFIITAPVIFVTRMSRLCHNRDMKITGAKTMNFGFFFQKKIVKSIVFAPVIFETRM